MINPLLAAPPSVAIGDAVSGLFGRAGLAYYDNLRIADMYTLLLFVFFVAVLINAGIGWLIRRVTRYSQTAKRV